MIVIKDLKKAFGDHVVLPCVNMEIKEREVVVIIGPSGSGKSTLLRSITHLEQPTAGKIFIAGEEVDDKTNIDHIRAEVGMVFQHFNLFENMTVLQNLTLAPIQVRKMSKEKAEEIAFRLLDKKSRSAFWIRWACAIRLINTPLSSPAVRNNVWLLPAHWRCVRRLYCSMNRPLLWTRKWSKKCLM